MIMHKIKNDLISHMATNDFIIDGDIIINNNSQKCYAYRGGIRRRAWYETTCDPFNLNDGSLICSYGFHDSTEQYHYSSHGLIWELEKVLNPDFPAISI